MNDLRSVAADLDEIDEILARLDDETGDEADETSAVDEAPVAETGRVETETPPGSDDWLATAVDPMSGPGRPQDDDGPDDQAPSFAIR